MSYSSNYDLSPKSNDSLSSSLDNNFNSWSPFSTPCFSPYPGSNYAQLPSANNFQYSYVSDQMNTRRAIKSIPSQGPYDCRHQQHNSYGHSNESSFKFSQRIESQPISVNTSDSNSFNERKFSRQLPKRSEQVDLNELIKRAEQQRAMGGRAKQCTFCKTNGETEQVYNSHCLKDYTDKITCPILLRYSCPICGATGDKVHTKKYCPTLQRKNRLELLNKLTSGQ